MKISAKALGDDRQCHEVVQQAALTHHVSSAAVIPKLRCTRFGPISSRKTALFASQVSSKTTFLCRETARNSETSVTIVFEDSGRPISLRFRRPISPSILKFCNSFFTPTPVYNASRAGCLVFGHDKG